MTALLILFVLQPGGKFDPRSSNNRDFHPSGIPRPSRGRGQGRGKGNNFGGEGHDSDYGSSQGNDGLGSFPGDKVEHSPGRDPWGWGNRHSGGDGDWGRCYADRSGHDRASAGSGNGGRGWDTGGFGGSLNGSSSGHGWGGAGGFGGRAGGGGLNPNDTGGPDPGFSDDRRSIPSQSDKRNGWSGSGNGAGW